MKTAAKHPAVAIKSAQRIGLLAALIHAVPIEAPLGHVSMHVVQARGIRRLLSDPQCRLSLRESALRLVRSPGFNRLSQTAGSRNYRLMIFRGAKVDTACLPSSRAIRKMQPLAPR